MISAIINVRTQRQCPALQRILEAGRGPEAQISGFDRNCTTGTGRADAIGAGTVSSDELRAHVRKIQKEVRQRAVCKQVLRTEHSISRSCAPTHYQAGIDQNESFMHIYRYGLPMTPLGLSTASGTDKERDQCANTGLFRKESWIVTFGNRSDRFEHA